MIGSGEERQFPMEVTDLFTVRKVGYMIYSCTACVTDKLST